MLALDDADRSIHIPYACVGASDTRVLRRGSRERTWSSFPRYVDFIAVVDGTFISWRGYDVDTPRNVTLGEEHALVSESSRDAALA